MRVDADEAVRLARLARAAGLADADGRCWIKLEVTPEPRYLLPDPVETLRAAELLVADGFVVLPYMPADPILAKRLEEAGCATVMPLGSWIGSNRGLRERDGIEAIVSMATVPVVVDAGIGAPSHASEAMEMGVRRRPREHGDRDGARSRRDRARVPSRDRSRTPRVPRRASPRPGDASASSPFTGFLDDAR